MSVFQNLHRHLTKVYSDTKQSYETAAVASKTTTDEDPIVKALHREFRNQQDRLLAWGLQWSDSNAAPSPDVEIDKKLDQAGLGHVVASIMSDIQRLLVESEMIQNPQSSFQDKVSAGQVHAKAASRRTDLTPDDIAKSRSLLSQLVACIDSLYKLSESRRSLSAGSQLEKPVKDVANKEAPVPSNPPASQPRGLRSSSDPVRNKIQIEQAICEDTLFIDAAFIRLDMGASAGSEIPPPYDEVMPLDKARFLGRLDATRLTEEQHLAFGFEDDCPKPIIVEYLSTMLPGAPPADDQYRSALRYARQIHEQQSSLRISHAGVLRLLGYTVDVANARHGFVYEMPIQKAHGYDTHLPILCNLRFIIPSKRDDSDPPSSNLEDRFRLAFNVLLGMLQLSVQRLSYQNLNSANILILLDRSGQHNSLAKPQTTPYNIRHPYMLHSPISADTLSEAKADFSASIYRHSKDTQVTRARWPWALDIYSFGLILLEIGLWIPVSRLWKSKYTKSTFTSRIKSTYIPKLASRCGTAYMKVVQICVSAPDMITSDSTNMPSRKTHQFWCTYMVQIGHDLARCCAIDVNGPPCEPDLVYFERLNGEQSLPESTSKLLRRVSVQDSTSQSTPLATDKGLPACAHAATDKPKASPVQQTILKKWNNVDIPQECLDQWNTYLMPRVSKLLQKALDSSRESCSASLMMVGKTPETAKTTICIQCVSVEKVRECLRRNFRCKDGWGLVVLRGDVRRSGKARKREKRKERTRGKSQSPQPTKSAYQPQPQLGASIGAFRDNKHLPPVSYGGAILVDGKPYGMTVHHMLDAPSDDDDEEDDVPTHETDNVQRCAARGSDAWLSDLQAHYPPHVSDDCPPEMPEVLEMSDDDSDSSTIRPDYIDLESGAGSFWFAGDRDGTPDLEDDFETDTDSEGSSDIEEEDDDDRISVGDIIGIDPADDEEVFVTQPAIDDVEDDFFPCMEDRDDEHLMSHALGYIHASSGIRRVVTGSIKHEVDWALIKIRDERLALRNTVHHDLSQSKRRRKAKSHSKNTGSSTSSSIENSPVTKLTSIAPSSTLARLPVHCHGRTSGLQSGRISPALALVKLHGRTSFSSSWVVEGGGFGIPGDSGAWIYDPKEGRLCGHVLAWGSQSQTAYMAPMEVLFEDIRRRLGAQSVELPCAEVSEVKTPEVKTSKQFMKSALGFMQEGMEPVYMPPLAPAPPAPRQAVRPGNDEDVEMALQVEGQDEKQAVPQVKQGPLELALSSLQIADPGPKLHQPQTPVVVAGLCEKNKDVPNSLACQVEVQARPKSFQEALGGRVLGSRVA